MSANEFKLIERCFLDKARVKHAATILPNGDDASVHQVGAGQELVVSTDTSLAGVHWPHDFPLKDASHRAVCAALSDLAAMGATARWAWVSVMTDCVESMQAMGQGVADALNHHAVELAGGDTVNANINALTVTVSGILPRASAMRRNAAQVSDKIWLVGKLGASHLGLRQWQNGQKDGVFVPCFRDVHPKLAQGQKLRELGVKCCIDVSDGLLQDAGHIAKASGVGMRLEVSQFPGWKSMCETVGEAKAPHVMLTGGEDYALLFTAPRHMTWLNSLARCVGECVEHRELDGVWVQAQLKGENIQCEGSGYDHFE